MLGGLLKIRQWPADLAFLPCQSTQCLCKNVRKANYIFVASHKKELRKHAEIKMSFCCYTGNNICTHQQLGKYANSPCTEKWLLGKLLEKKFWARQHLHPFLCSKEEFCTSQMPVLNLLNMCWPKESMILLGTLLVNGEDSFLQSLKGDVKSLTAVQTAVTGLATPCLKCSPMFLPFQHISPTCSGAVSPPEIQLWLREKTKQPDIIWCSVWPDSIG